MCFEGGAAAAEEVDDEGVLLPLVVGANGEIDSYLQRPLQGNVYGGARE